MRQAKIVCTIGPASADSATIERLISAGMDVARLNFSHGDHASHREVYEKVRAAAGKSGKTVAILADLAGPKIRLGEIENGGVELAVGDRINFTSKPVLGTADRVSVNYAALPSEVCPGMQIFADDGRFEFRVIEVHGVDILCEVIDGGTLRSRKGLNVPMAGDSIPALTDKDRVDLEFAAGLGVDFLALSFVRKPEDVAEVKSLAGDIPIIAKMEKPSAIERLAEIADVADGMMVARGDMGIEIGYEKVPLIQKRIIREMNRRSKPVITATQMLESMVSNPQPTRAEVSDVANAVLDGTDAVMLSAETAAGEFPVESVRTMARIIEEVENTVESAGLASFPQTGRTPSLDLAIAHAAARLAIDLRLKAIAVYTESGRGVALASSYRPRAAIVGLSPDRRVLSRMPLLWGTLPLEINLNASSEEILRQVERGVLTRGIADAGDEIAVALGEHSYGTVSTNVMKIWKLTGQEPRSPA